jgi:hypothetical protein
LSADTVTGRRLSLDAALRSPAIRADTTTYTGDAYHNRSTPSDSVSHQVKRFDTRNYDHVQHSRPGDRRATR